MMKSTTKSLLKSVAPRFYLGLHNTIYNRRFVGTNERFLVVRHPRRPEKYNLILDFVERNCPELRCLFETRTLGSPIQDWSPYRLHIPWLQDPVQSWSMQAYTQAKQVLSECDSRGIPVINRVDRHVNAVKSHGAELMGMAGIRTPHMVPIENAEEFIETLMGLTPPLIVRKNWGHGGLVLHAETRAAAQALAIERIDRPVAVEFIDVRSPVDGLYRKYRYVVAGDVGVPLHLQVSEEWKTKGRSMLYSESICREELEYLNSANPHHDQFVEARKSLGLDFVAFDYGIDSDGQVVVWEANQYPNLHFPRRRRYYRKRAVERTIAAIVSLYLIRAGFDLPPTITTRLPHLSSWDSLS